MDVTVGVTVDATVGEIVDATVVDATAGVTSTAIDNSKVASSNAVTASRSGMDVHATDRDLRDSVTGSATIAVRIAAPARTARTARRRDSARRNSKGSRLVRSSRRSLSLKARPNLQSSTRARTPAIRVPRFRVRSATATSSGAGGVAAAAAIATAKGVLASRSRRTSIRP